MCAVFSYQIPRNYLFMYWEISNVPSVTGGSIPPALQASAVMRCGTKVVGAVAGVLLVVAAVVSRIQETGSGDGGEAVTS